jgi:hypothetical protein
MIQARVYATTSKPVLLADRQLQPRDNSGGFAIPPTYAKHTIGRTSAQGGVGSMATETGRATSARGTGRPNDQFPQSAKQNAQTPAMTGPGATTGSAAYTKVKQANRAPGQSGG